MRILYIDIDSLRPDHLGCYGYHRNTSPNIDRIAAQGVRFNNCHVTDAPCLPSRTALFSGRAGIHTGVINHGGVAAEPFIEGPARHFRSQLGMTSWMRCLRDAGLRTATVSPFGERHSAWHWYANFSETHNTGRLGIEVAGEISPPAIDWINRNGKSDNWFLHVNFWDPHVPYRTPLEYGDPFSDEPLPAWLTEEVRRAHWDGYGPHSAREPNGYGNGEREKRALPFPRQPRAIDSMDTVRAMFDGYDTAIRYADDHLGRILNALADQGVLDDTVVIISSDHGENLGEMNIYSDHETADQITSRVPLIIRWPGVTAPRVDDALLYHIDWAATVVQMLGRQVPDNWDGRGFADALKTNRSAGRDYLVVSQGAWTCQRAVRFGDHICIRTYHDGYHEFPDTMLFDIQRDPHEQHNLADSHPDLVARSMTMLEEWHTHMMRTATHPHDPMRTILSEGGPHHTRRELTGYLTRLRETGRGHHADALARRHPNECAPTRHS